MRVGDSWGVVRVIAILGAGIATADLASTAGGAASDTAALATATNTTTTVPPGSLSFPGKIKVRNGVARLHTDCHGFSGAVCEGTVELKVENNPKHPKLNGVIGSAPYSSGASQHKRLKITLSSAAAAAVAHAKPRLKVTALIKPTGGATVSKTVFLYPAK